MKSLLFASYILVWPLISAAVLALIVSVTMKDLRAAREEGRDVV